MSKIKIYTKSGDEGETSLFSGQRVSKNDPFIEALGSVDECNAALGIALTFMHEPALKKVKDQLKIIQSTLFDLGASLATPRTRSSESKIEKTRFDNEGTAFLENWIDEMEEELPELHTFILPGGHTAGAYLHLARCICRRAERSITPLVRNGEVSKNVMEYMNRLSDYLFVTSRFVNHLYNQPETQWIHHGCAP